MSAPERLSEKRDVVRLCELRDAPLSVDEVMAAVADPAAGGIVTFTGTVRDGDHGRDVLSLAYSAHPSAVEAMRLVADAVAQIDGVRAVAVVHRTGDLHVGDLAVVVAVAAVHRSEAFAAARRLIDEIKATVAIWKHQRFAEGDDEWVGV